MIQKLDFIVPVECVKCRPLCYPPPKQLMNLKKQLQKKTKKKLTGDLSLRNPFRSEPFPGVELPQVGAASIRPGHRARCGTQTHQHTEKHRQTHLWRCSPFSSHAENPRQFLD